MKTVFVHPERCIGCKQCEAACAVAHSTSKSLFWSVFETPLPKQRIHAEPGLTLNSSFPNKCRHCDPAPCIQICPTGAISRAADFNEVVLIDGQKCISCGMCAIVCPFDVITYHPASAVPDRLTIALKCDQCIDRLREGKIPACVEACKVGALQYGELNEMIKAARTKLSESVSVAVGQIPSEQKAVPPLIDGWRTWGAQVTYLNTNGHGGE